MNAMKFTEIYAASAARYDAAGTAANGFSLAARF